MSTGLVHVVLTFRRFVPKLSWHVTYQAYPRESKTWKSCGCLRCLALRLFACLALAVAAWLYFFEVMRFVRPVEVSASAGVLIVGVASVKVLLRCSVL